MNGKSKKYYQGTWELNKQNVIQRPGKSKPSSEKDIKKPFQPQKQRYNHLIHFQPKSLFLQNRFPSTNLFYNAKPDSKLDSRPNMISSISRDEHFTSEIRDKVTKLPKISKDEALPFRPRRKMSKSYKKIATEPHQTSHLEDEQLNLNTLNSQESMKEILVKIVKNKENRHSLSIEEEIDKLESLTKRYSCLRKDLVSIQEDILTINFRQRCRERGRESESISTVFM